MPPITEPSVARLILRIPTSTRVRERELVRTRNFVRVSGTLSLSASDLSANIPPFNPQKLLTEGVANADDAVAAEPDAEVSFVTCDFVSSGAKGKAAPAVCDLNSLLPKVKASGQLSLDDVVTRVRDVGSSAGPSALLANADAAAPGLKLSYAAEGDTDPYVGFEARVVPENITLLPKTTTANEWSERAIVAKKGDTVGSILRDLGATTDDIKAINAVLGARAREGGLKEGQKLRVLTVAAGLGRMQPLRVIIAGDSAIEAAVALSDKGQYVALDVRNIDKDVAEAGADEGSEDDGSGVRLYQSIYETALRNNVPSSVIEEFVRIYSYDVDFQRKVQSGDSFEMLYAEDETVEGRNEVRYASLTVGGDTKKYYRYQTADDGAYDYYDETGKSAKKFLVRKPVAIGIMRSRLRRAQPSAAALYEDAHRGRLGGALRHADLCRRQRLDRRDRGQGRLRQICAHPPRQRLPDRLRPHDRFRARPQCRQQGAPGPGDRLRRLDRPFDRRARALRDPDQ